MKNNINLNKNNNICSDPHQHTTSKGCLPRGFLTMLATTVIVVLMIVFTKPTTTVNQQQKQQLEWLTSSTTTSYQHNQQNKERRNVNGNANNNNLVPSPPSNDSSNRNATRTDDLSPTTTRRNSKNNNKATPSDRKRGSKPSSSTEGQRMASFIEDNLFSNFRKEYYDQNSSSALSLSKLKQKEKHKQIFQWTATRCLENSTKKCSWIDAAKRENGGPLEELDSIRNSARDECCLFASEGVWKTPFSPTFFDELSGAKISKAKILSRFEQQERPSPPLNDEDLENQDDRAQKILEDVFAKIGDSIRRPSTSSLQQAQMALLLGVSRLPRVPMKVRYISPEERKRLTADLKPDESFDNSNDDSMYYNTYNKSGDKPPDQVQNVARIFCYGNSFVRSYFYNIQGIFRGQERYFDRHTHDQARYVVTNYGDYSSIVKLKTPSDATGGTKNAFFDVLKVYRPDEVVLLDVTYTFVHGTTLPIPPGAPTQGRGYNFHRTPKAKSPQYQNQNVSKEFFPLTFSDDPIEKLGGEYSAIIARQFRLYNAEAYKSPQARLIIDLHVRYNLLRHYDCGLYRRRGRRLGGLGATQQQQQQQQQQQPSASCFTALFDVGKGQQLGLDDLKSKVAKEAMMQLGEFYQKLNSGKLDLVSPSHNVVNNISMSPSAAIPQWILDEVHEARTQLATEEKEQIPPSLSKMFTFGFVPSSSSSSPEQQVLRKFVWVPPPTGNEMKAFRSEDDRGHTPCIIHSWFPRVPYEVRANRKSDFSGVTSEDRLEISEAVKSLLRKEMLRSNVSTNTATLDHTEKSLMKKFEQEYISKYLVCRDMTSTVAMIKFGLGAFFKF